MTDTKPHVTENVEDFDNIARDNVGDLTSGRLTAADVIANLGEELRRVAVRATRRAATRMRAVADSETAYDPETRAVLREVAAEFDPRSAERTVHLLWEGRSFCPLSDAFGLPGDWPPGHVWVSAAETLSVAEAAQACSACQRALQEIITNPDRAKAARLCHASFADPRFPSGEVCRVCGGDLSRPAATGAPVRLAALHLVKGHLEPCLVCGTETRPSPANAWRSPPDTNDTTDYFRSARRCDGKLAGSDIDLLEKRDQPANASYAVTVQGWGGADSADVVAVIYAMLLVAGAEPNIYFQTHEDHEYASIVVSRYAIGPALAVVPTGPLSPPISFGESIVLLSRIRACGEQLARTLRRDEKWGVYSVFRECWMKHDSVGSLEDWVGSKTEAEAEAERMQAAQETNIPKDARTRYEARPYSTAAPPRAYKS